jgi:hypothetical protein
MSDLSVIATLYAVKGMSRHCRAVIPIEVVRPTKQPAGEFDVSDKTLRGRRAWMLFVELAQQPTNYVQAGQLQEQPSLA